MANNKKSQIAKPILDATQEMSRWMDKHYSTLAKAIAEFAIFCPPEIFFGTPQKNYSDRIKFISIKKKDASESSLIRRIKCDETKGKYVEEGGTSIYLDDNTVINKKYKNLVQLSECRNYMTCHIWDDVYIPDVFSCVANIVLLPTSLAGLSDYCQEIKDLLMYRAYELYNWKPQDRSIPVKPIGYDKLKWNSPKNFVPKTQAVDSTNTVITERLILWSKKPASIVYQTIAFVKCAGTIQKSELVEKLYDISKNPEMVIASLMTDRGNAYGKILKYTEGKKTIVFEDDVKKIIDELWK